LPKVLTNTTEQLNGHAALHSVVIPLWLLLIPLLVLVVKREASIRWPRWPSLTWLRRVIALTVMALACLYPLSFLGSITFRASDQGTSAYPHYRLGEGYFRYDERVLGIFDPGWNFDLSNGWPILACRFNSFSTLITPNGMRWDQIAARVFLVLGALTIALTLLRATRTPLRGTCIHCGYNLYPILPVSVLSVEHNSIQSNYARCFD
jgi:hypothetical protein